MKSLRKRQPAESLETLLDELQQRGVEYSQLFTKHVALRPAVMERIPPMEHR